MPQNLSKVLNALLERHPGYHICEAHITQIDGQINLYPTDDGMLIPDKHIEDIENFDASLAQAVREAKDIDLENFN